jgi:hypothetical protein
MRSEFRAPSRVEAVMRIEPDDVEDKVDEEAVTRLSCVAPFQLHTDNAWPLNQLYRSI